ncbi:MAG: acyl-CoA carboxylase subunit beta [Spirochaetales bacterium]|uniref:Acyl-CoA carboxylase subunit beta n=1 Tax=Candidatus Thalassospirochaeta sargassi TaxID=3119039 RepID=A0AAJ1MMY7_9SPIO|nr:acyl-CoA carboxylase subunit beta [Spirochaetales bacterium]
MGNEERLQEFKEVKAKMLKGGGDARIKAQHEKGKKTARERIEGITDEGSFIESQAYIKGRTTEFGMDKKRFSGDGVVTGSGKINGKQVFISSQDFTVLGGSLGEMHAEKIAEAQNLALKTGSPFIQVNDSGGARIQEGILSLNGYAKIFKNNTLSSGVIPQFSVILGPCAGGAVYSPAITDFIFMVDGKSHMYITGPDVIKAVTGEIISHEDLGGASAHCAKSGNAHFRFETEEDCYYFIRALMDYLPSNNQEQPPVTDTGDNPDRTSNVMPIIPDEPKKPYDVRDIIDEVFDRGSFLEVHKDWAKSVVVGFAKLNGRTVGLFANQPNYMAAALDINSSDKGARFLRFCDSFNIPIISLVDVPGYLPGIAQEHGGIIRHGAKLLYAIAEATVPKLSLIIRKSYGGSMIAMSSKSLGYDRVLAYPTAEIAVMGAEGAANIISRKEIKEADDPAAKRAEKIAEFQQEFMNPYVAAGYGLVDDIIDPEFTRIELIRALEMNLRKREDRPVKKHGNIPL